MALPQTMIPVYDTLNGRRNDFADTISASVAPGPACSATWEQPAASRVDPVGGKSRNPLNQRIKLPS
jgi:hypothetical protein